MTIKQLGGVFGRNPTFNDVTIEGQLTFDGDIDINSDLKVDGDLEVTGTSSLVGDLSLGVGNSKEPYIQTTNSGRVETNPGYSFRGNLNTGMFNPQVTNTIAFSTGGTERARISSAGNLSLATGNLVIDTSGKGIDFSATAGTGTSELLSDYEEGTFTPELLFGGNNSGMTYTNQDGVYTKVGNVVHFQIYIRLSAKGTSTGNTSITGLPFSTGFGYNVPAVWWTNMGTGLQPFIWAVGSSTTLIVQANNSGSSQNITNTSFTDTSRIVLSGTYRV